MHPRAIAALFRHLNREICPGGCSSSNMPQQIIFSRTKHFAPLSCRNFYTGIIQYYIYNFKYSVYFFIPFRFFSIPYHERVSCSFRKIPRKEFLALQFNYQFLLVFFVFIFIPLSIVFLFFAKKIKLKIFHFQLRQIFFQFFRLRATWFLCSQMNDIIYIGIPMFCLFLVFFISPFLFSIETISPFFWMTICFSFPALSSI